MVEIKYEVKMVDGKVGSMEIVEADTEVKYTPIWEVSKALGCPNNSTNHWGSTQPDRQAKCVKYCWKDREPPFVDEPVMKLVVKTKKVIMDYGALG